ncbi:MAG: hypothetical protein ABEI39_02450 [Halobacteriales archaeon]
MRRRRLLAALSTVLAGGCLDRDGRAPGPRTPSTETPTATPSRVVSATFRVTERSCGAGLDTATVTVADDRVIVAGNIAGEDACDAARLADVRFDGEALLLSVRTARTGPLGPEVCAQCRTDIDYAVTVDIEGGPPETVVVRHGDEVVARVERA